jgi:uncharacterized protein YkwD
VGSPPGINLDDLIAAHNRERAKAKLPALQVNALLAEAARDHARDMAEHHKLSHEGSDGSDSAKRVKRRGYRCRAVGENVAEGQETIAEVMRSWMNSAHHRANILGDFTEVGAAVVADEKEINYWCVDFGRPWGKVDPARDPPALIAALNRVRSDAQKAPVAEDAELARVAEGFGRDLAARHTVATKDRDGRTPFDILERQGYRAPRLASSFASGESDPAKVVRSWLQREEEREDLLADFDRAGAGAAVDDEGVPYWVLLLAKKPTE